MDYVKIIVRNKTLTTINDLIAGMKLARKLKQCVSPKRLFRLPNVVIAHYDGFASFDWENPKNSVETSGTCIFGTKKNIDKYLSGLSSFYKTNPPQTRLDND